MTALPRKLFQARLRPSLRRFASTPVAALTLLFCLNAASAQEAAHVAQAAEQRRESIAGQSTAPRPPQEPQPRAPRTAQPSITPAPAAKPARLPAAPSPASKVIAPAPPAPPAPPRVVTIVHRLSGWRLLTLLAASSPHMIELDDLPSATDIHTNLVAGFLSDDNRTVIARLPQAEAEDRVADGFAFTFSLLPQTSAPGKSEYTVVLSDGRQVEAKLVGMDSATGLSVLEAVEPLTIAVYGDSGHTDEPEVGQRIMLYAPAPLAVAGVSQSATSAPRINAVGSQAYVYANIDQAEGLLTGVMRTPAGRPFEVTARAVTVNPAWTGAVATDAAGALVGIVSRGEAGSTQIVPVEMMRLAVERVMTKRANVPQPWLGARGDAASNAPLDFWINKGWEPGRASALMRNREGVLLTAVAPGTPAALAGLRPGDLVSRVGGREVRSVQEFSLLLKEQPIGSSVEFTVLRAPESDPVKLSVRLSGTQNPVLATAEAEARAARAGLLATHTELLAARSASRNMSAAVQQSNREEHFAALSRLKGVELRFESAMREASEAGQRLLRAYQRTALDGPPVVAGEESAQRSLFLLGLRGIALTARGAARFGAKGGLLIVTVEEGSPAEACGLRPGDVIETAAGRLYTPSSFSALVRDGWERPVPLGLVRSHRRTTLDFSLACSQQPEGERRNR